MGTEDKPRATTSRWDPATGKGRRRKALDAPDVNEVVRRVRRPVVDLATARAEREAYAALVLEFADELRGMASTVRGLAIAVACAGKWRRWEEQLPLNASYRFDDDVLMATGDPRVDGLMQLYDLVADYAEWLGDGEG